MQDILEWHKEKWVERTINALKSNFFKASFFQDRTSLVDVILDLVKPNMRIGFGGSLTVREVGLVDAITSVNGVEILDHWKEGLDPQQIHETRIHQLTCDLFLSGLNALTESGEIINIDGMGNRVNAVTFGPKKIIMVAGYNKIVTDIDSGLDRIRNVAAPMNAKRLNLSLPCAETGYCHDCKSELRICRIVSILQRKPNGSDISVYIVNESLGL